MWFGVSIGIVSAVMQSASYIFSRRFVTTYHSSVKLVIYSQLWMGLFGAIVFAATVPFTMFPHSWKFAAVLAVFVIAYNVAFYCFFRAVNEIESSRLSSLLGLKVAVIALIMLLLHGTQLRLPHYAAVVMTAVSAVGMNFSGVRISRRGALFLALTLLGFSTTDITGTMFVKMMPGGAATRSAICVTSLSYVILGIISSAALLRMRFERATLRGALPYSALWFSAMLLLFASFGIVGVVFGSIIQASRGLISVLFGVLLARTGFVGADPDVPRRIWIRRAVMALIMIGAIGLYSWSSAQ